MNPSGIKPIAYFIPMVDIKTWPTMSAAPTTAAEATAYDGDFTLQTDKTFISIYSTHGVGKVEFEITGERDCKVATNKATLSYPDMNDEAVEVCNRLVNSNGVFLVPYFKAGGKIAYAVLGNENLGAEISPKGTSGDKAGTQKGVTFEISATDPYVLPRYTGVLPLSDGSLNCATGVFTAKESA